MLDEYAYVLAPRGMIYIITDVKDLFDWMEDALESHPLFQRIPEEDLVALPFLPCVCSSFLA